MREMRETIPSGNQVTHGADEQAFLVQFWARVDNGVQQGLTFTESIEKATLYLSDNGHISDRCVMDCPACNKIELFDIKDTFSALEF